MARFIEEIKKQDVIDQLTWDDSVNADDVHVEVDMNTVQLTGQVPDYAAKIAAEKDAYKVAGVMNVKNYLEIKFPPSISMPSDEEITSNVKNMLLWNSRINSDNITVTTNRGIVNLSGSINSYWEKYLAGDAANSASGVIEVVNNLTVSPIKTIIDMDIENDIKNAYKRSSLIDEDRIYVDVNAGVVHLSGVVSNYLIKNEAYDIAMYTAGVTDVVDDLTIG